MKFLYSNPLQAFARSRTLAALVLPVLALAAFVPRPVARAQGAAESLVYSFSAYQEGTNPQAPLVRGNDGNFYGTTSQGGSVSGGSFFQITPAGVVTTLHFFTSADGTRPQSGLVLASDGSSFYGTTTSGGSHGSGTIYNITTAGVVTVLHNFLYSEGDDSVTRLLLTSGGTLYGTAYDGGANDNGSVFSLTSAGVFTVVHSFTASDANGFNTDGAAPQGGLILGSDNNLYGTTGYGGYGGFGTVFQLTTGGVFTPLHSFASTDGATPASGLVEVGAGTFYGTTTYGGANSLGTFYQITSAGVLTTKHDFVYTEGAYPQGDLLAGGDGSLYATTGYGGSGFDGAFIQITLAGAVTTLHNFVSTDGYDPQSGVVRNLDGTFFGTTYGGGASNAGTVFSLSSGGVFTSLHSFAQRNAEGAGIAGPLIQGGDSNFYGTATLGGAAGLGSIYRVTPTGVVTAVYSFTGPDGSTPLGKLVQSPLDNNFYGTTSSGGTYGGGTIFKLTPAGVLTTLHSFGYAAGEGNDPSEGLTIGSDHNFYGTTLNGGVNYNGTVFQYTPGGVLTILHSFGATSTDGYSPVGGLVEGASPGVFYGTTSYGGDHTNGTAYQVTAAQAYTVLHSFSASDSLGLNMDGAVPTSGLLLASDTNFYGTTGQGGANGDGTLYQMTAAGVVSPVHTFSALDSSDTNIEGSSPTGNLLQALDGSLYGVTAEGGLNGYGAVYRCTLAGSLTALYSFSYNTGGAPRDAGLLQANGGDFYGTTYEGGANANGVIYKIPLAATTTPPPVITSAVTATTKGGVAFSYQITASGSPTSFRVTGLPAGLGYSASTGLISGTPSITGTFTVTLGATNAGGTSTATLTLTVTAGTPPANDNFANAQVLSGMSGSVPGTNVFATLETGEPNLGGQSIWYLWTAPITGSTNFNTFGSSFDTVLGIYTGTAVNALTLVTSNDDSGSGDTSSVNFGAQAGTTYAIAVDGYDNSEYGNVTLSWTQATTTSVPAITSAGAVSATVGQAFSYQIVASNTPISYAASGLPGGLSINSSTGLITGTPSYVGTFSVTLSATNPNGTGLLTLTLTVGTVTGAAPVISSSTTATTTAGQAFSYQIVASNTPTSYNATGLPASLNVSPSTGLISGVVVQPGIYPIGLSATNSGGAGTLVLTLTVNASVPIAPVISSTLAAGATSGIAFSYQITASNTPTSFGAAGLPPGLSVNTSTGLISGAPTSTGTFPVTLSAANAVGTGTAVLSLVVSAPPARTPVVTSVATAAGQLTLPFTYQIAASNAPTSFGATGLPTGLSVSAGGLISGTPTQAGSFAVNLSATNAGGTGTATLTITVAPAPVVPPVVSSVLAVSVEAGQAFSYQITASNSPTGFDATALPAGLGVNGTSGAIVGTPTQAGTYTVALNATNAGGTGTATLVITVTPALPVVTLVATVPSVTAGTGDLAEFTLSLSAAQTTDTVVDFTIKGTAVNGTEYVLLKASKKIKAGKTSKPIKVQPLGEGAGPGVKHTVILTLQPGTGYTVGTTGKVKVKILGQ